MNNPRRPPGGLPVPAGATQDRQALLQSQQQHQQQGQPQQQQGPQQGPQGPQQGPQGPMPPGAAGPSSGGPDALRGFIAQAAPAAARILAQMGLTKTATALAAETSGKPSAPKKHTPRKNTGTSKKTGQTTPRVPQKTKPAVGKPTVRPKAAKEATHAVTPRTQTRSVKKKTKG